MAPALKYFYRLPWSPSDVDNTPSLAYDLKLLILELAGFLLEQKCLICQQNIKNNVWELTQTFKRFAIVNEPTEITIKWLFTGMFYRFSFIIRCFPPFVTESHVN